MFNEINISMNNIKMFRANGQEVFGHLVMTEGGKEEEVDQNTR